MKEKAAYKASILVIDDDEGIRTSLANVLDLKGYAVDTAKDGKEGLTKYKKHHYDLALIDIVLPDMKGTELLSKMSGGVVDMVKVIVTGYPDLDNAIKSVNEGADGYVIKPFDVKELLDKVAVLLKKQAENRKYSEEKVTEYIKERAKELSEKKAKGS
ncbi:MAG TPA: response regulator [Conexivisphaerales archaeon]|nr:response regulator [Conexivisphaerales archaeon]